MGGVAGLAALRSPIIPPAIVPVGSTPPDPQLEPATATSPRSATPTMTGAIDHLRWRLTPLSAAAARPGLESQNSAHGGSIMRHEVDQRRIVQYLHSRAKFSGPIAPQPEILVQDVHSDAGRGGLLECIAAHA